MSLHLKVEARGVEVDGLRRVAEELRSALGSEAKLREELDRKCAAERRSLEGRIDFVDCVSSLCAERQAEISFNSQGVAAPRLLVELDVTGVTRLQ